MFMGGYTYVGHRKEERWKGSLPYYAFWCPRHGIVQDYPHGYEGRLECPVCRREARRKYAEQKV